MNKKLMIAMVVIGMSALYVRFQVIGMDSEDRKYQEKERKREAIRLAAEKRRDGGAEPRVQETELSTAAPRTEDAGVFSGLSAGIVSNNLKQMWKYKIAKEMPYPPKLKKFLLFQLPCEPRRIDTKNELCGQNKQKLFIGGLFSPDGTKAAVIDFSVIQMEDIDTGNILYTLQHNNFIEWAEFSPDGTKFATASIDRTAAIWDVENGNRLQTLRHEDRVNSVVFSSNGRNVITASSDKTAAIWDVLTGTQLLILEHSSPVGYAQFSKNGRAAATCYPYKDLWDVSCLDRLYALIEQSMETLDQYKLLQAFEETFENKRPIGKIQATPKQWATFLTLPQEVQDVLRVRIKSPYEGKAGAAVFTSPNWKPVKRPGEHMRRIIEEQGAV